MQLFPFFSATVVPVLYSALGVVYTVVVYAQQENILGYCSTRYQQNESTVFPRLQCFRCHTAVHRSLYKFASDMQCYYRQYNVHTQSCSTHQHTYQILNSTTVPCKFLLYSTAGNPVRVYHCVHDHIHWEHRTDDRSDPAGDDGVAGIQRPAKPNFGMVLTRTGTPFFVPVHQRMLFLRRVLQFETRNTVLVQYNNQCYGDRVLYTTQYYRQHLYQSVAQEERRLFAAKRRMPSAE